MTESTPVPTSSVVERPLSDTIRRRLVKGSAWVFGGKLAGMVLGLTVNALLARLLGHGELGTYFLVFSVGTIGSTTAQFGMDRAVVRLVSASIATGELGRARDAIRISFLFGCAGALALSAALLIGLGDVLATTVYRSPELSGLILVTAGWLVGMTLQSLVAETFRGFQRFGWATLMAGLVVDIFSVIVFGILWLSGHSLTTSQAIVTSAVVTGLAVTIGGIILVRVVRRLRGGTGSASAREVFDLGWPLVLTSLASFMVGTGVDLWVIAHYGSQSEVAVYGAASRLVFFVATPFLVVSQVVPPIVAELHAQGKRGQLQRSLREVATVAVVPSALVFLLFVLAGGAIMGIVYGDYFTSGATVLAILSFARVYAVYTGSCGAALMMTGHQRTMMTLTVMTGFISLGAEVFAAPRWGMTGVATATACAQILQNTLQLAFTKIRLGIWTHARFTLAPVRAMLRR